MIVDDHFMHTGDQCVHEGFDRISFDFDFAVFAYCSPAILDSYSSSKELLIHMAEHCCDLDLADGTCCRYTAQVGSPSAWPERHEGKRRGKGTNS